MDGARDLASKVTSDAVVPGQTQSEQDRIDGLRMELNEEMARARRLIGEIDQLLGRDIPPAGSVSDGAVKAARPLFFTR